MSCNIHVRGVDDKTMNRLREEAHLYQVSVNAVILDLLKTGLGIQKTKQAIYHDLDALAGTWSEKKAQNFLENISDFEKIDKEIWK